MAARRSAPQSRPHVPSQKPDRVKVPSWDLDPVWSLARWPVTVQFGPTEVEIPAMSAAEWLGILMAKNMNIAQLLELIPDSQDLILDGDMEVEEIREILMDMITTVSGRQWWITLRLIGLAQKYWDTLGAKMITSVNAEQVSLAAWMTVLQLTIIEHIEPDKVPMFVAQVQAPPPGVVAEVVPHQDLTAREFLAMAR